MTTSSLPLLAEPAPARERVIAAGPAWALALCVSAVVASCLQLLSGQAQTGFFLLTLCFVVCAAAAWLDVATRRIPNLLTYPAILIGVAVNSLSPALLESLGFGVAVTWSGATGFQDGLLGLGVCAMVGIISFIARGLGGGDVKLVAALGALLGLGAVVGVLLNALVIAGLIGIVNWTVRGTLVPRMQVVAGNLLAALFTRRGLKDVYPFGRSEAPFGLSLLLGLILAQFFEIQQLLLNVGW